MKTSTVLVSALTLGCGLFSWLSAQVGDLSVPSPGLARDISESALMLASVCDRTPDQSPPQRAIDVTICEAYVIGVVDGLVNGRAPSGESCVPKAGIAPAVATRVVSEWLVHNRPLIKEWSGSKAVRSALEEYLGCSLSRSTSSS